jgi:hypothetical protein
MSARAAALARAGETPALLIGALAPIRRDGQNRGDFVSHFTTIKTRIADVNALVKALADLGFKQVEVHEEAQHLYGYQGDQRAQAAEVIIRRRYVGHASNDIGFKRQPDGKFEAIISQFDRAKCSQAWLDRLTQNYAYHTARAKLEEQGFILVSEERPQGGPIRLVLRRTG